MPATAVIEIKDGSMAANDRLHIPIKGEVERELVLTAISNAADSNQIRGAFRIDETPGKRLHFLPIASTQRQARKMRSVDCLPPIRKSGYDHSVFRWCL